MMKRFIKNNNGEVIVEATIVFPIVILCVFLMIFVGNAYLQKSNIEAIVAQMTFKGAAQCADPLSKQIASAGTGKGLTSDYEIEPYRYWIGGMDDIETDIEDQIGKKIKGIKTGLFSGMTPKATSIDANFNNFFVYSTFSVEVDCEIPLPMKLPGMSKNFSIKISSRYDVPVSDTPEFIRNVNMVEDWVEATEEGQAAKSKAEEIMSKVAEYIN